eukprot:CAMPEP_0171103326 /NCGR_PEP_ID=MMETSP0766_2-20121228/58858_1 /TAXON_ID=439317 /ORGANISM="Gambierdiscus australes, Strain CAWD 149" /LENGTH=49 /DNA_ID= /DNA_START= /DNA_END= /DNA_ORIENTATION=
MATVVGSASLQGFGSLINTDAVGACAAPGLPRGVSAPHGGKRVRVVHRR